MVPIPEGGCSVATDVRPILRSLLAVLAILFFSLPACLIVTFLLFPFWSWLEATFQVESVGHSGPADWCFFAVYLLFVGVSFYGYWRLTRRTA